MGQAIPYDYRRKIISERERGKSYSKIAKELGYSQSGIKKIWYAYQKEGESSLKPKYFQCGRKSSFNESVRDAVNDIRTGKQGAPFVYSMLKVKHPDLPAPSIRTLQRWWQEKQTALPRGRPPEKEKKIGRLYPIKPGK